MNAENLGTKQHKCIVEFGGGSVDCMVYYSGLCVKSAKTTLKDLKKFVKTLKHGVFDAKFCLD